MVMQSQTVANRVVVFGEVYADGKPVLCALELKPDGRIQNFIKVASAYSKTGAQALIDTSDILYLDPDKKRTDNWLSALRLQLPAGVTNYGSIGSVTYSDRNVKGEFVFNSKTESKSAIQEALERAGYTTDQSGQVQDMQNSVNDAQKTTSEGKRLSVAGENSYDADLSALEEAILRIQNGDDRNAVIRDTGWWLGKDGKWRYEISDKNMKFNPNGYVKNPQYLSDYVKHKELFRAYPWMRDIKVRYVSQIGDSSTATGVFNQTDATILLKSGRSKVETQETILHEMQHAIQAFESFKGGSSQYLGQRYYFNLLYDLVKDTERYKEKQTVRSRLRYILAEGERRYGMKMDALGREEYRNDYGEIEARAVADEKRRKMTVKELREHPIDNDGIVFDKDSVNEKFLDNLRKIGYTEAELDIIKKKGLPQYDELGNVSESYSARSDILRSVSGIEGEGEGRSNEIVSRNYDRQTESGRRVSGTRGIYSVDEGTAGAGNQRVDGVLTNESTKASVSAETEIDDGALSYEELEKEVGRLRERYDNLRNKLKASRGTNLNATKVREQLADIIRYYESNATIKEVDEAFKDLWRYAYFGETVIRDENGTYKGIKEVKEIDASEIDRMVNDIARTIFDKAVDVSDTFKEYGHLVKDIHDADITISDDVKEAFGDEWNEFRKHNFGRIGMRNSSDGTSNLDAFYRGLAEQFPEFFNEDIANPAEQLRQIADVSKTLREEGMNPQNIYGLEGEAVLQSLANDILNTFYEADQRLNIAARAEQKVSKAEEMGKQDASTEKNKGKLKLAEKDLADKMHYGKKIAELRRKYENRVKTVTEKFETKISDRSEAQQARYQKKMAEKRGKELARRLAKPTKTAHIPFDFEGDVFELLKKINWASATAADRETEGTVNAFLERIAKRGVAKNEDGFGFSKGLRGDIEAFDVTKPMDAMDSSELHRLNELLRRAIYEINQADKVFHSGESAAVASLKARQQFHAFRKELTERGPIRRGMDWALNYASDPESFFAVLNVPEMTEAYQNLAACQDKLARNVRMLSDEMEKIVGEKGIPRDWRETTKEYTFASGRTIRCTPAQLMTVYLYSKQEDSRKCLVNEKGGAAFAATEKKFRLTDKNGNVIETNSLDKMKNLKDAQHVEVNKRVVGGETVLTDGDLDMIRDTLLTNEQRAMADALSELLNTKVTDMANETSLEVEGYRKFFVENYFPMSVFGGNVSIEKILQNEHTRIMNESFTKERSDLAGKKLLVDDVFSVMNRHLVSVSQYNAYKKALVDFQKIYTIRPNGESNLRNDIISSFGAGENNRITAFIDHFFENVQGLQMATDEETLLSEKFLSHYKAAQVAANLSVIAKQPTAILRAMPEFSPKGIAAMGNLKTTKADMKEMLEHSGLAAYKSWGYSEYSTGMTFEELYNKNAKSLRKKFDDAMSWGAQKADELTWAAIWRAAKADTSTVEEATAKFNEVIRKTQVVDSAFTSSSVTKQKGLAKLAFAFKNEPLKTFNYIRSSAYDAAVGKQGAKKKFALVLTTSAINTSVVAAITAAFSMLRDEEEEGTEEFLSKWTEDTFEEFIGNLTILGGDIINALQGETVERMDLAAFTDAANFSVELVKFFQTPKSEQKKTFLSLLYDGSRTVSNLTGIPVGNMLRAIKTFSWSVANAIDSPKFDYTLTSLFYNVEGVDNAEVKRRFRSILTDALDQGKYGDFETIRQDLRSKGFAASEVEKAIAYSDRLYDAWCEGPSTMRQVLTEAEKYTDALKFENVISAFNSRKTDLVNTLYDATKVGDEKAARKAKEALLNHRDVKTYQKLQEREVEELLETKYRKQLETEIKNRLADLYRTEAYDTVKDLILKEYKNFGVTSDEIDRIVRNMQ